MTIKFPTLDNNPCPEIWGLKPCCDGIDADFKVTNASVGYTLAFGTTFVDTNGLCWFVGGIAGGTNITTSIVFDSNVPSGGCETCTSSNPCPEKFDTYFFTVRNCCTGDSEVVELSWYYISLVPKGGTVSFAKSTTPNVTECWELFSWSSTGPATITVASGSSINSFDTCDNCINNLEGSECPSLREIVDCCEAQPNKVALLPDGISFFVDTLGNCWRALGASTGTPTIVYGGTSYGSCGFCIADYPCPA